MSKWQEGNGRGQNVDKKGNVDNFPSYLQERLFHVGSGLFLPRAVFHVEKRNIHKSGVKENVKICG